MTTRSDEDHGQASRLFRFLHGGEELLAACALGAMVLLPLAEIVVRPFFAGGIPGSIPFVEHLTLWVGFLGAGLAARRNKLIALATATFIPDGKARRVAQAFAATVGAGVSALLAWSAVEVVAIEMEVGGEIALGIPSWVFQLVLPFAFAVIAIRLMWGAGSLAGARGRDAGDSRRHLAQHDRCGMRECRRSFVRSRGGRGMALGTAGCDRGASGRTDFHGARRRGGLPLHGRRVRSGGGAALRLRSGDRAPPAVDSALHVDRFHPCAGPVVRAAAANIPRAGRLDAGWHGGGPAPWSCAFFTIFTGGSGVTILALGGLLLPALLKDGYRDRFSVGLLTASGSLGLLLPPAMPLILYAIVAQTAPENLFIGGLLPGLLLIGLVAAWGMREGVKTGAGRHTFEANEALAALWQAKWELLLPVVVLAALFSGRATLVETSALTALYAAIVTGVVHRDFRLGPGLGAAFRECVVLIGGVLIILSVAKGFTAYMVDVDIPFRLLEWTQARIESPLLFLLALNVFLLIVGCVMDIFSAIVVVVPLITEIGAAYDIDPVHLGIIFIANLELGYLTPPVGLNLFLASYRFDRPLLEVYRASVPLLIILGIGVLIITYVPWLTLGLLELVGRQ